MDIWKIIGIALCGGILSITVKKTQPEIAISIAMITGIIIFFIIIAKLVAIIEVIKQIVQNYSLDISMLNIVFKIIGISYIAEFAISSLKDAGEESISTKVEMASKIIILSMAIPIIKTLLDTVIKVLP